MADRPDEGVAAFRGVTLVEVLMSLLIMSIGVSAVAALFPISVLRSIQATQLTNAAILKTNVETLLQMRPELVFDPDGDGNFAEHVGRTEELHYIIDPSGYFEMATGASFSIPAFSTFPTLSALNDPTIPNDSSLRGGADWFGNVDTNLDGVPEPFAFLPRYDGGVRFRTIKTVGPPPLFPNGFQPQGGSSEEPRALRSLASTLSKLGDGWETNVDTFADSVILNGTTAVGVQLPVDVETDGVPTIRSLLPSVFRNLNIPDPGTCRAVVFSEDGTFSVALPLVGVSDGTPAQITWAEVGPFNDALRVDPSSPPSNDDINQNGVLELRGLPPEFIDPATSQFKIGRVLLQSSRTHDYNWLLTVRRGRDGQARGVDIVVTHNKGITPDDERLYTAGLVQGASTVNVFQDGGLSATGDIAEPAIRKSGYLLDVENARWYRIRDHREGSLLPIGALPPANGFVITLETPVISSSIGGKVMFLPGVIDVYPMGSIAAPDNL